MKYLILLSTVFIFNVHAVDIKPGLWEMTTDMKVDGKSFNPMEKLQQTMGSLSPEKRKQMMQAMEKSGINLGQKGIKTCMTEEMIQEAKLNISKEGDCTTKVTKRTPKKIVSKYTCKDGSSGTSTVNIKNPKSYTGEMKMKNAKGKVSEMSFRGKFIKSDCGNIKPANV
ncbi:MAG: hypothetical protein CME64_07325 [Halobacteriovoraceae bacterium]|nr:hypothetical protein [Halobacteriovoraceae bacterium]|tara:strand:+ start:20323 stop:20829 length:507 start_codon:yes stop_codon:yes gene_type:complete